MKKKFSFYSRNMTRLFVLFMALFIIDGHFYVKFYPQVKEFLMNIPIPVLNCYSMPSTTFACPIGTIQHFFVIGFFSFITMGMLLLVGGFIGRWTCGWLCPFGFVQELLHNIPTRKFKIPGWTRYIKYLVFIVLVVIMPLFVTSQDTGMTETWFCKLVCPAGTLGAGIPHVLMDDGLHDLIGIMYWWKIAFLVIVLLASVFTRRPFCSTLCPLGAFLGLFNKISFLKLRFIKDRCYECNLCIRDCPMGLDPRKDYQSPECIRCMNCVKQKCFAIRTYTSISNEIPHEN